MSAAARRARLGTGHALAWVAYGLAAGALATDALAGDAQTTDALRHQGASVALAIGAASALAAAALGLCARTAPLPPRALRLAAAALAAAAAAVGGALALLGEPPHALVAAALGLAAGVHGAAVRAEAAAQPALAPRVRPAPTLLAAAVGVALAAAAELLPADGAAVALLAAAALQLGVVVLAARARGPRIALRTPDLGSAWREGLRFGGAEHAAGDEWASSGAQAMDAAHAPRTPTTAVAPALLALLAIAAAGAAALAALRPALSAIGAVDPEPAAPLALTLAMGALLGPPLAVLAERLPGSAGATLATVGGAAALAAPVARPGALDLVAATILGMALAASVALAELARRSGTRLRDGALVLLVLAGAASAAIAALLLAAVPLPDVVLGAAIACLVAGVGAWAPGVVGADAGRDPSG